jgi:hypothetical protein
MAYPMLCKCCWSPTNAHSVQFIELFNNCAEFSKKNEPFVWVYELVKGRADLNGQVTDVVIREV